MKTFIKTLHSRTLGIVDPAKITQIVRESLPEFANTFKIEFSLRLFTVYINDTRVSEFTIKQLSKGKKGVD